MNEAISQLREKGIFIWDHFLSDSELSSLREDFLRLQASGGFKRAGIGKGTEFHLNDEIRRDEIHWFDESTASPAQKMLSEKLEVLKHGLNEALYLGLWELEGHYAHYPVGGGYQAHVDRFHQDDSRTISMVLYLHSDWTPEDGGQLRIHSSEGIDPVDILPAEGRLVCFLSAEILHEVLPAKRPRLSFAAWWKKR